MVVRPMTLQAPLAILPEMADLVTALADTEPYDLPGMLQLRQRAQRMIAQAASHVDERPGLTPREQDALDILKMKSGKRHRPVTTVAMAADLLVADSWAYQLLANLRRKGYARRIGTHKSGGWMHL